MFIRLTNGEDLVAEVIEHNHGKITLSNPLKIVYSTSLTPGFLSMSLMQWVFLRLSKNQTFEMNDTNILVQSIPDKGLLDHYHSSVATLMEKGNKNFEFTKDTDGVDLDSDEDISSLDEVDGLELLRELLSKSKKDKGSLH